MKKNVEVIEKTIKEEKITYISKDGKEFKEERDCIEWEKSYNSTIMASFNSLEKIDVDPTSMGFEYSSDEHSAYMIRVNNKDDVVIINSVLECNSNLTMYNGEKWEFDGRFGLDLIGNIVLVETEYWKNETIVDADWGTFIKLEDHKKKLNDHWDKAVKKFDEVCDGE